MHGHIKQDCENLVIRRPDFPETTCKHDVRPAMVEPPVLELSMNPLLIPLCKINQFSLDRAPRKTSSIICSGSDLI